MKQVVGRRDDMVRTLKSAGLKLTPQRLAIIEQFADDHSHPTAQDLFERLRERFPTMSFATVYNTLDSLAKNGLSGTLRLGGAARFDPNTSAHHHAVCDGCGRVEDIPELAPEDQPADPALARVAPGFSVRAVERTYRGLCATCRKRSERSAR